MLAVTCKTRMPLALIILVHLLLMPLILAKLVNTTVDDDGLDPKTGSRITYIITPSGRWSNGQTCTGCEARPNASQTYNGTWHDCTYDPSVLSRATPQTFTFEFTGMCNLFT